MERSEKGRAERIGVKDGQVWVLVYLFTSYGLVGVSKARYLSYSVLLYFEKGEVLSKVP